MDYVDAFSELEDDGSGEQPWVDLVFDMMNVQLGRDSDGILTRVDFEARASTDAGVIGFAAGLEFDEWRVAENSDFPLFWGYATLRAIGEPTDRLVAMYQQLWNLPDLSGPTTLPLKLLAAGLGAHPADQSEEKAHLKLFFEPRETPFPADHPEHGQLFFNFSLQQRRVWLLEKDPSFRRPVLSWLTGQFGSESHASSI